MSLTNYITLGRSGLRVSPFALGAMTFGEDLGSFGASVKDSETMLDTYIGRGGNFIDTANFYTLGHSEKIIGDHIGRYPAKRDRLVIATKFFGNMFAKDPNGGGASRKAMHAACHESLRRLQTNYIDLYWLHLYDRHTPMEETLRALEDLVRAGKVRYIGFSDTPAWKVAQAQTIAHLRGWAPLIALQIEYSLLERTVEGELVPMALEMGLGITPWSPLKGGALTGRYTRANQGKSQEGRAMMVDSRLTPEAYNVIDALLAVAKEADTTPAKVALAWLRQRPGVASPIVGARTLDQLEQNLAALSVTLTPKHMEQLNAASKPRLNFPADFLEMGASVMHGGLSINGATPPASFFTPKDGSAAY